MTLEQLKTLSEQGLQELWGKFQKTEYPIHLPKKYVIACVFYSYQELKEKTTIKKSLITNSNLSNTIKSGTKLIREYQGKKYEVTIIDGNFFYMGNKYKSLSKIAKEITSTNWNGKVFFRVTK